MKEAGGVGDIRFLSFNIRIQFACFIQSDTLVHDLLSSLSDNRSS